MHEASDRHDTSRRSLTAAPETFGLLWTVQLLPCPVTTSVWKTPLELNERPTAVHEVPDEHDTPDRLLVAEGIPLTLPTAFPVSLQVSISGSQAPVLVW